ncbi:hypothetical protein EVG20_g2282 [Dentipellis fragilis]|uniref:C2H2-type domain-containing protein n=1 Tax=Dentipellis fragilis TaxID=205917 RepID=A0A4Y9Z9P7_9AGAM|nr:hypothetical protein EVG20_g2282 [Dentipellis fragilis]
MLLTFPIEELSRSTVSASLLSSGNFAIERGKTSRAASPATLSGWSVQLELEWTHNDCKIGLSTFFEGFRNGIQHNHIGEANSNDPASRILPSHPGYFSQATSYRSDMSIPSRGFTQSPESSDLWHLQSAMGRESYASNESSAFPHHNLPLDGQLESIPGHVDIASLTGVNFEGFNPVPSDIHPGDWGETTTSSSLLSTFLDSSSCAPLPFTQFPSTASTSSPQSSEESVQQPSTRSSLPPEDTPSQHHPKSRKRKGTVSASKNERSRRAAPRRHSDELTDPESPNSTKGSSAPLLCTMGCSESFSRRHDRFRHEVSKHGRPCEWTCKNCRKFFSTKKTFQSHKCQDSTHLRWIVPNGDDSSDD